MIAIVSDIHSNLAALEAVLEVCDQQGVEKIYCLGDVIGYGPEPAVVAQIARERFDVVLMGNHEEALVTGKHRFNPYAAKAIDWTRQQLSGNSLTRLFRSGDPDLIAWFKERKTFELRDRLLLVHGSIYDPVHDYVDEPENPIEAQQMIDTLSRDFTGFEICFAGHNHTPFVSTQVGTFFPHDGHATFRLPKGHKAYVCVGSVGQPRDRDWRSSFAILNDEELTYYRVSYDVARTQKLILDAGLHPFLAERLSMGV